MKRILLITCDFLGDRMAGPAVRAVEMAQVLATECHVCIACPGVTGTLTDLHENIDVFQYGDTLRQDSVSGYDGVIIPASINFDSHIDAPVLVDLYDPFILSNLPRTDKPARVQLQELRALKHNLQRGDYFVCASERQRSFWLGMLAAEGRINIDTFSEDSNMSGLIGLAPFGISAKSPELNQIEYPGDPDAFRLIWAGGIWDWFDPLTLIQAVDQVNGNGLNVSLYFMGTSHPNPKMTKMAMVERAKMLARQSGILNQSVFFGNWIPYRERGGVLTRAHAGISTHYTHLETYFSFRTRILDYIWAGLPFICTEGDAFGDIVDQYGTGCAVQPENIQELVEAIETLSSNRDTYEQCKKNVITLAESMHWEQALKSVKEFCVDPHYARDVSRSPLTAGQKKLELIDSCEDSDEPAGEIIGSGLSQKLVIKGAGLCKIALKMASYDRINHGVAVLQLLDARENAMVTLPFSLETVEDNVWREFTFGPLPQLKNNRVTLTLTIQDATVDNTVTLWVDTKKTGAKYMLNGREKAGSINYRLYAAPFEGDNVPWSYDSEKISSRIKRIARKGKRWLQG